MIMYNMHVGWYCIVKDVHLISISIRQLQSWVAYHYCRLYSEDKDLLHIEHQQLHGDNAIELYFELVPLY